MNILTIKVNILGRVSIRKNVPIYIIGRDKIYIYMYIYLTEYVIVVLNVNVL